MPDFRYPQFCALARAAEILGERWTVVLLRELFVGPQRFSDLRRRLPGLSSSVLAERLERLTLLGVVRQRTLPPPAACAVYELTEHGAALDDVLGAMTRWGARFLGLPRPDDRFSADWIPLALGAFVRRGPTPVLRVEIRIDEAGGSADAPVVMRVCGGRRGTRIERVESHPAALAATPPGVDAVLIGPPYAVLGVVSGVSPARELVPRGTVRILGDVSRVDALPALFEFPAPPRTADVVSLRAPSGDDAGRNPGPAAPSTDTRE